jgi:Rab GDP dissociation inhibitor
MVETNNPEAELKPAFDIIGDVLEKFITISDLYEPIDTTFKDNVFVTSSFDSQSHFENDIDNVIQLYQKISGKELKLDIVESE